MVTYRFLSSPILTPVRLQLQISRPISLLRMPVSFSLDHADFAMCDLAPLVNLSCFELWTRSLQLTVEFLSIRP